MKDGNEQGRRQGLGWEALVRGTRGHPLHPPFTDLVIGMFALAAGLAIVGYAGAIEEPAGRGMWLALIGGLIVSLPAALTGFADWLTIPWGTPRWRAATIHLSAMLTAVTVLAFAAWQQHDGYRHGNVTLAGLVLTIAGVVVLTAGGWFGGSVVYVHGMRVASIGTDVASGEGAASADAGTGDTNTETAPRAGLDRGGTA